MWGWRHGSGHEEGLGPGPRFGTHRLMGCGAVGARPRDHEAMLCDEACAVLARAYSALWRYGGPVDAGAKGKKSPRWPCAPHVHRVRFQQRNACRGGLALPPKTPPLSCSCHCQCQCHSLPLPLTATDCHLLPLTATYCHFSLSTCWSAHGQRWALPPAPLTPYLVPGDPLTNPSCPPASSTGVCLHSGCSCSPPAPALRRRYRFWASCHLHARPLFFFLSFSGPRASHSLPTPLSSCRCCCYCCYCCGSRRLPLSPTRLAHGPPSPAPPQATRCLARAPARGLTLPCLAAAFPRLLLRTFTHQ